MLKLGLLFLLVRFPFLSVLPSKAVFIYIVRSPRFIPSPCFILSPQSSFYTQSAVRGPQSAVHLLYWPKFIPIFRLYGHQTEQKPDSTWTLLFWFIWSSVHRSYEILEGAAAVPVWRPTIQSCLHYGWFLGVADHQMTSPLHRFVFLTIIRFKFLFNLYKSSFRQTNAKCLSVCQYRQIHWQILT